MFKFRTSIKRKINLAIALLIVAFSGLGAVTVPVLRDLAEAVTRADRLAGVLNAVTDAQVAVLTLSDRSHQVDAGSLAAFVEEVNKVAQDQSVALGAVKGAVQGGTVQTTVSAIEENVQT